MSTEECLSTLLKACEEAFEKRPESGKGVRTSLKEVHGLIRESTKFWSRRAPLLGSRPPRPEALVDTDTETIWQQLQSHSRLLERWARAAELWLEKRGMPIETEEKEEEAEEDQESKESSSTGQDEEVQEDIDQDQEEEEDEEEEEESEEEDDEEEEEEESKQKDKFFDMDEMEKYLEEEEKAAENDDDEEEDDEVEEEEGGGAESKYAELFGEEKAEELARAVESARELERENIKTVNERDWELRGEVEAKDRPENSLLGVDATWEGSKRRRQNLAGTELTEAIESIIRERVSENRYDDLVPAALQAVAASTSVSKQKNDALSTTKTPLGEKSSLGLAQEYEQDYLNTLEASLDAEKPSYQRDSELDALWTRLASKLDTLAHFAQGTSTAPRQVLDLEAAAKAANTRAVSLEDTTPAAVSIQETKAPEQIHAKTRGKAGLLQSSQEASRDQRKAKRAAKKRVRAATRKKIRSDAEQLAAISPTFTNPFQGKSNHSDKKRKNEAVSSQKNGKASSPSEASAPTKSSSTGSTALFEQLTKEVRTAIHGASAPAADDIQQERKKQRRNKSAGAAAALKL